jgi:hypothetical protein
MDSGKDYPAKDRNEIIEDFKRERDSVEVLILELNQQAIKTASKYAKKGGASKEELAEQKNLRYQISELEKSQKSLSIAIDGKIGGKKKRDSDIDMDMLQQMISKYKQDRPTVRQGLN